MQSKISSNTATNSGYVKNPTHASFAAWRMCDRGPPAPTLGRHAEWLSEELLGTYSRTGTVQTERHDQAPANKQCT